MEARDSEIYVTSEHNMAGWWRSVALLLTFLLLSLVCTSYASFTGDRNRYKYTGSLGEEEASLIEDAQIPVVRLKRQSDKKPEYPIKKAHSTTKVTKDKSVPWKCTVKTLKDKDKPRLVRSVDSLNETTSIAPTAPANDNSSSTTTTVTTSQTPSTTTPSTTTPTAATTTTTTTTSTATTTTSTATSTTSTTTTTVDPDCVEGEEDNRTDKVVNTTVEDTDPDSGNDSFTTVDGFNTENTTVDHHRYYKSQTLSGADDVQQFWVDLDSIPEGEASVVTNEMLSASHRRAATVTLTFEFPFYGHLLKNITIATGGFLFTGDFVHTWLAATQYIAPLMANFDTSMSDDASVRYADNGTSFTVQWNNVLLKDHADAGTFTFQVTLHKNGDIVFTYKQVPVIVTSIGDDQHPVKVGLSDAYIVDRTIFFVRRKTIYEYHKIDMKKSATIGNWTAIFFKALPTCVSLATCNDCLSENISFQCQWCPRIGRCSNGLDRHRQEWLHNGCEALHAQSLSECSDQTGSATTSPLSPISTDVNTFAEATSMKVKTGGSSVGTVVGVVFLVAMILGVAGWITYAYFFPHSSSGQFLIKYRPSTWSWRRGEARYTAAAIHSIHM
ncbi:hypothetical protein Pmani_001431 [Petrolisthes manimaculis]|uniref:PSI domain-containing protein n=1 Tax=Petrolisthes manimaculis TaxID=1843537 RepID=A0AAE1ULE1_9EUCA|nr:hypothetical protein Pmani_001431 [Petrolisthes manimaculis]